MKIELRPTESLKLYEKNSRTHPATQIDKICNSIQTFGFTIPLLVADNTVIAGNARLTAARKLEMKEVPVIDRSDLTEAQIKAYVIADNRIAEDAGWDQDILRMELHFLENLEFDLDVLGFDHELDGILGRATNPDEEWEGMPEFENEDVECHRQIIVRMENEYQVKKFIELMTPILKDQTITDNTKFIWFPGPIPVQTMVDKKYD